MASTRTLTEVSTLHTEQLADSAMQQNSESDKDSTMNKTNSGELVLLKPGDSELSPIAKLVSSMRNLVAMIEMYSILLEGVDISADDVLMTEFQLNTATIDVDQLITSISDNEDIVIGDELANYPEIITSICKFIKNTFPMFSVGLSPIVTTSVMLFEYWCWIFTADSKKFRQLLSEQGMILHFLYQLGELRKNSSEKQIVIDLVSYSIGVLSSFAASDIYHCQFLDIGYLEMLTPYICSPIQKLRYMALFTFSSLVFELPENFSYLCRLNEEEIQELFKQLSICSNQNYDVCLADLVFNVNETLTGLVNFTILPENTLAMLKLGVFDIINNLLLSKAISTEIRLLCLQLLMKLCINVPAPCSKELVPFIKEVESIISLFQPIAPKEKSFQLCIMFINELIELEHVNIEMLVTGLQICYEYKEYKCCTEIYSRVKSRLNAPSSTCNEAKLIYGKALFYQYQREKRSLPNYIGNSKEYRVKHHNCVSKAKEAILILGTCLDYEFIDEEGSKILDLCMIDYVSETNNLQSCKRCMLCRKKSLLQRSHLWPEALLNVYSMHVNAPKDHKLFYKIDRDGALTRWSSRQMSFWMFCKNCEIQFSKFGESDSIPLLTKHIYDSSDPAKSLNLDYKEWLYHFCIGLVFRGLVSTDGHISLTAFTNSDELYDLLKRCRHAILNPDCMHEVYNFQMAVMFTPNVLGPEEEHSGFMNTLLTDFGLFALSDIYLSTGTVCMPREAQFFLAHSGIFNIIVPLGQSKDYCFHDFLISPDKGILTVPAEQSRMGLLPKGLVEFLHLLGDCTEITFLEEPKELEEHNERVGWIKPPSDVIGVEKALDQDLQQKKCFTPSWYRGNPKHLVLLPRSFKILRPDHRKSSVILPPGHRVLLHHTSKRSEEIELTLLLCAGLDEEQMKKEVYVIYHLYQSGAFVSGGFLLNPHTLTAESVLPDKHEKILASALKIYQEAKTGELKVEIENMLHEKGFTCLYSLLLHTERSNKLKVFDKKCVRSKCCWYCRDLCEICMQPNSFGCAIVKTEIKSRYTFCHECWTNYKLSEDTAWPTVTAIDSTSSLPEDIFPKHTTLSAVTVMINFFTTYTIILGVDKSEQCQKQYLLIQACSLSNQEYFEYFVSKDLVPLGPLPFTVNKGPFFLRVPDSSFPAMIEDHLPSEVVKKIKTLLLHSVEHP